MTADFAPDGTWTWRGYTFSIPRAVVEQWEEGQKVSYLLRIAHPNPWQQHPWLREGVWAEDDLGNRYYSMEEHQALSDQGAFRVYMGQILRELFRHLSLRHLLRHGSIQH